MTNDLEKQFFDTFGIEPKSLFICKRGYYPEVCTQPICKGCNEAIEHGKYPQITDSILLSLIKIACKENIISLTRMKNGSKEWAIYLGLDRSCIFDEKSFKNVILKGFIEYSDDRNIYTRVQALFKEQSR